MDYPQETIETLRNIIKAQAEIIERQRAEIEALCIKLNALGEGE